MKTLSLALMVGLLLPTAGIAGGKDHDGKGGHRGGRQWARMAKKLDLSDKQKEKLKSLRADHRKAMGPLMKERRMQMKKLRKLVKAEAGDKKIGSQLRAIEKTQQAIRDAQEKHRDATAEVLTPTQRAKFMLQMGKHSKRWQKGKRGRGGRRGRR